MSLLVTCDICGANGVVPEPSEEDWAIAFSLNGAHMDWPDSKSVVLRK